MTPEPDPPAPTLPKLTVNVSDAKGVKYLGDYTSFAQPDVQTYNTFKVDGVTYTLANANENTSYLAINRSANSGASVNIGYFVVISNALYFGGHKYFCDSSGNITQDKGVNTDKPVCNPANTELDAMFNDPNALFELEVIQ